MEKARLAALLRTLALLGPECLAPDVRLLVVTAELVVTVVVEVVDVAVEVVVGAQVYGEIVASDAPPG